MEGGCVHATSSRRKSKASPCQMPEMLPSECDQHVEQRDEKTMVVSIDSAPAILHQLDDSSLPMFKWSMFFQ